MQKKIVKTVPLKVMQQPGNEIPAEILAKSIVEISEGMKRINETRLTRKALVALIHDNSKIAKSTIEIVLNNLESLEHNYLRRKVQ